MRRRYQIRILDLLLLTTGVALAIVIWPRNGTSDQFMLAGWTAMCGLQLFLYRQSWSTAPDERERARYAAYVIAYPACFVPILAWLSVMISLLLNGMGFDFSAGDAFVPVLFLLVAWCYAVIAIPVSFFTAHKPLSDQAFFWLRFIAMINLVAPAIPVRT